MAAFRSVGIMSGTSADGVDAVLLQLEDVAVPHAPQLLSRAFVPFSTSLQAELMRPEALSVARLAELHFLLPQLYAQAVRALVGWEQANCVGMHGQTLVHQVERAGQKGRCTLQIGSSAVLAAELGVPVVADMRAVDVALGGQGAPLVPLCHWFFAGARGLPALVVNFGGICNFTWATPACEDVLGYDTGPGMMLSDAFAQRHSQGAMSCDLDGQLSRGGKRVAALYAAILDHPFVQKAPPKSAGREQFGVHFAEVLWQHAGGQTAADVAFTLIEASVAALAQAIGRDGRVQGPIARIVVAGGGAHNPTLLANMRTVFKDSEVRVETSGVLAPQNHEAAAMALIAARTLHGLPSSLRNVTGAREDAVLGHIHAPPHGRICGQKLSSKPGRPR